jgi:hypothetical protein
LPTQLSVLEVASSRIDGELFRQPCTDPSSPSTNDRCSPLIDFSVLPAGVIQLFWKIRINEFRVKSGETFDLGDILIEKPETLR